MSMYDCRKGSRIKLFWEFLFSLIMAMFCSLGAQLCFFLSFPLVYTVQALLVSTKIVLVKVVTTGP